VLEELDFRSHTPIYLQVMERIKHLVSTGELSAGDQLPTVRHLAAELRVNFNTIARAYRMLDEAGVISTQQGRGTYVLEPPPPQQANKLRHSLLEGLTRSFLAETHRLGFDQIEVERSVETFLEEWKGGHPPSASEE
jgi:GntR family transcriptional regulator